MFAKPELKFKQTSLCVVRARLYGENPAAERETALGDILETIENLIANDPRNRTG